MAFLSNFWTISLLTCAVQGEDIMLNLPRAHSPQQKSQDKKGNPAILHLEMKEYMWVWGLLKSSWIYPLVDGDKGQGSLISKLKTS